MCVRNKYIHDGTTDRGTEYNPHGEIRTARRRGGCRMLCHHTCDIHHHETDVCSVVLCVGWMNEKCAKCT